MIDNATIANYVASNATMYSLPTIENQEPLVKSLDATRINQQMLLPNSAKARIIGDILSSTSPNQSIAPSESQPTVIANNTTTSFIFTIADNQGRAIIAVPDIAVYDNVIASNTAWPTPTYNMLTLPLVIFNDRSLSNGSNVVTRVEVGNVSGTPATVIVTCSWRIITQPGTSFTQASTTQGITVTSP